MMPIFLFDVIIIISSYLSALRPNKKEINTCRSRNYMVLGFD